MAGTVLVLLAVGYISPAAADETFSVSFTDNGIYPRSSTQMLDTNHVGDAVPNGTAFTFECETVGDSVSNGATESSIWNRTSGEVKLFLPNSFLETGANDQFSGSLPRCEDLDTPVSAVPEVAWSSEQIATISFYDRSKAREWAVGNAYSFDKYFSPEVGNCTLFASRVLFEAGFSRTDEWTDSWAWFNSASRGDFDGPSKIASSADYFKNYLVDSGYATIREVDLGGTADLPEAQVGDIVQYDLHGATAGDPLDGVTDHTMIITSFSGLAPLVTGVDSDVNDNEWQYATGDSAITDRYPGARAYLIHVIV